MSELIGKVIKELEHVFDVLKSAIDINRKRRKPKTIKNKPRYKAIVIAFISLPLGLRFLLQVY